MDAEKFKQGFVEGVYKRMSEMTPEERAQVVKGKEVVLDAIGFVGALVDVADAYVDKALLFVEGIYTDIKDDTVPQAQSPKAAVKPEANASTLNSIYQYLLVVDSGSLYWQTLRYFRYPYDLDSAKGLIELYNEVVEATHDDVEAMGTRARLGLSENGYS